MPDHIIIFDTETTGLPVWKEPSDSDIQPHLVQLAALLVNTGTRAIAQSMDVIIKPDGWTIPQETTDIHGTTNEHAMDVGISEKTALLMFLELWGGRTRVAHNTTFDNRMIRIGTKRYFNEQVISNWKEGEYECTMRLSKAIMSGKQPKLEEAYMHFMGKEIQDAHTAMGDAKACMDIYFAIQETIPL